MSNLLYRHQKNCWTVDLFDDGYVYVYSDFAKRLNVGHRFSITEPLSFSSWVPQYLRQMIEEMQSEYR